MEGKQEDVHPASEILLTRVAGENCGLYEGCGNSTFFA